MDKNSFSVVRNKSPPQYRQKYSEANLENFIMEKGEKAKTNPYSSPLILEKSAKKKKKMIDLDNYLSVNDELCENNDIRKGAVQYNINQINSDLSNIEYLEKPKILFGSHEFKNSSSHGG
jgi:hypothetical protein